MKPIGPLKSPPIDEFMDFVFRIVGDQVCVAGVRLVGVASIPENP
jgi:hypothetical protein